MKVDNSMGSGVYAGSGQYGVATPRQKKWPSVMVGMMIALIVGFVVGLRYSDYLPGATSKLDYSGLDEIYSVLVENFDGEIDTSALIDGAKRGMVAGLGDAYTQYFSSVESQEFIDALEGTFEGIGVELLNRDGKLMIRNVLDDTPAQRAGLKAGDFISHVDDTETISWAAESAVQIIRGPSGTKVRLTIIRENRLMEFEITRSAIVNPSGKYVIENDIGYLRIDRFSDAETVQLARTAAKAFSDAGVRGVVLDLRGNSGGYVATAVAVASLWLEKGQAVVIEKIGDVVTDTENATGNNILHGIPTVVLIDGTSASASEIVAGALADHGQAKLVGTKSFGKGSVQVMKPLSGGSKLKITLAKWFTPNGVNIDREGLEPDVEVKFDAELYKSGVDNQRVRAIELLK